MNIKQFGGKPLKRLDEIWRRVAHRAKAAVLRRWKPNLERLGYSRSFLRDGRWAAAVAVMCVVLVSERAPAGETKAVTVEALVAETLANNPEVNFYKAEVAAARGERQ